MNYHFFVEELSIALKKPLPGINSQLKMAPSTRSDLLNPGRKVRTACVLILLIEEDTKIKTIFIKRSESSDVHSGQISLPGGKHEKSDPNYIYTALRETHEEIGVAPNDISVIGALTPLYIPISNFNVLPFIGIANNKIKLTINHHEVQYVIKVPLSKFFESQCRMERKKNLHEKEMHIPFFSINGEELWGATAMIFNEFLEITRNIKGMDCL